MQTYAVDEEFRYLLPELDEESFEQLEADIIESGCRDAVVVWNGIILDGHNRYYICTKHDIPFVTLEKEFASREEALIWIVLNQISRRNLTPIQLSYFRGLHYRADKKLVKNESGTNQYSEVKLQNATKPKNLATAMRLANQYSVSRDTIVRDSKISEAIDGIGKVSPEAKGKILSGKVKLEKKALAELVSMSSDDLAEVAAEIDGGTYKKKKPASQAQEGQGSPAETILARIRPLSTSIGRLSGAFSSQLHLVNAKSERDELKTTLKLCIDMLEELYGRI